METNIQFLLFKQKTSSVVELKENKVGLHLFKMEKKAYRQRGTTYQKKELTDDCLSDLMKIKIPYGKGGKLLSTDMCIEYLYSLVSVMFMDGWPGKSKNVEVTIEVPEDMKNPDGDKIKIDMGSVIGDIRKELKAHDLNTKCLEDFFIHHLKARGLMSYTEKMYQKFLNYAYQIARNQLQRYNQDKDKESKLLVQRKSEKEAELTKNKGNTIKINDINGQYDGIIKGIQQDLDESEKYIKNLEETIDQFNDNKTILFCFHKKKVMDTVNNATKMLMQLYVKLDKEKRVTDEPDVLRKNSFAYSYIANNYFNLDLGEYKVPDNIDKKRTWNVTLNDLNVTKAEKAKIDEQRQKKKDEEDLNKYLGYTIWSTILAKKSKLTIPNIIPSAEETKMAQDRLNDPYDKTNCGVGPFYCYTQFGYTKNLCKHDYWWDNDERYVIDESKDYDNLYDITSKSELINNWPKVLKTITDIIPAFKPRFHKGDQQKE